jgi:enoyl-CoA hydratase/carnithine racemase
MTADTAIKVDDSDGIRRIVFSNPSKLNVLTVDALRAITEAVRSAERQKAILFTGDGDRSFCAGMHLDSFAGLDAAGARTLARHVRDMLAAVRTSPLPTAAMINGYCLGAAFELALACDFRITVDTAAFGLPEVKVGIPSVVDAALLQDYVGLSLAKEMILTGDMYDAATLDRRGLFNQVVPAAELEAATLALLSLATRHTRTVLASQKRLFEVWQNTALTIGAELSIDEFGRVFDHPETREQVDGVRRATAAGRAK